jgi:hypothetical protein
VNVQQRRVLEVVSEKSNLLSVPEFPLVGARKRVKTLAETRRAASAQSRSFKSNEESGESTI